MTRRPFDPEETGSLPGDLDPVARELERYAGLSAGEMPHGLADRVMASVSEQPTPRRGLVAWLLSPFAGIAGGAPRVLMVAGTMALAVLAVVVAGQLGDLFRDEQVGPSPSPPALESPSPPESSTPEPTPTQTPSLSPSPSPTVSASPTSSVPGATASPSEDDEPETPEPSDDDDDVETPEPSDDDSSGPGGGEGDSG